MSKISNVSSKLGEFMLKGYVLTDEGCPVCSIPMLRSPSGQSLEHIFCIQCQNHPTSPPAFTEGVIPKEIPPSSAGSGSSDEISRVSTPPTEVSSALSSPTFAPPPDPQETLRRRAQSDMASAEIGKRMLQGWAMLAEECPNESCYGVPLVRPPKSGGGQDPRKECVVCSQVYIYERNAHGFDRLVPLEITSGPSTSKASHATTLRNGIATSSTISAAPGFDPELLNEAGSTPFQSLSQPSTLSTLNKSTKTLEHSLHVLMVRLASVSNQIPLDHVTIGEIAHSVEQVTNALRSVKQLQLQESSRHA